MIKFIREPDDDKTNKLSASRISMEMNDEICVSDLVDEFIAFLGAVGYDYNVIVDEFIEKADEMEKSEYPDQDD